MAQDQESPLSSVENRKRAGKWILSSLPLLLSTLALLVSFLGYRLTAVRNVKPAIVVSYLERWMAPEERG